MRIVAVIKATAKKDTDAMVLDGAVVAILAKTDTASLKMVAVTKVTV